MVTLMNATLKINTTILVIMIIELLVVAIALMKIIMCARKAKETSHAQ